MSVSFRTSAETLIDDVLVSAVIEKLELEDRKNDRDSFVLENDSEKLLEVVPVLDAGVVELVD